MNNLDKLSKSFPTVDDFRDISLMEKNRARGNSNGRTEKFTMGSGKMVYKMVLGCGEALKEIIILGNGKMVKQMDSVYIHG